MKAFWARWRLSWFGVLWVLFSGFFVVLGPVTYWNESQVYDLLSREGKSTEAQITAKHISTDDDGDETYYLDYQFQLLINETPATFSDSASVSYADYEAAREGMGLKIIYAPSDPTVSRLEAGFGPPSLWAALLFSGIGLLFVGIGLFFLRD